MKRLFETDALSPPAVFSEGELYKRVELHGSRFDLYYGYYEECDRLNPDIDPMPIYPDFLEEPRYTEEGFPFVTKMQDVCSHYKGRDIPEKDCAECAYFKEGQDLIGVCICPKNNKVFSNEIETDPPKEA